MLGTVKETERVLPMVRTWQKDLEKLGLMENPSHPGQVVRLDEKTNPTPQQEDDWKDETSAVLRVKELLRSSIVHRRQSTADLLAAGKILLPIRLRHINDWGQFVARHQLAPKQVERALRVAERKQKGLPMPNNQQKALGYSHREKTDTQQEEPDRETQHDEPPPPAVPLPSLAIPDTFRLVHSRFQELEVAEGWADLIVADIQYDNAWLDNVAPLADKMHDDLRYGGAAVVWPGNNNTMEVAEIIGKRLTFMRQCFTIYEGPKAVLWGHPNCRTPVQAEPVLIFAKGNWTKCRCFSNVSYSTGKEKDWGHPMQKPLADMARWIRILSDPEAHVLDLTAGSYTAAVATLLVGEGRTYTGCEPDSHWVDVGRTRLAEFIANGGEPRKAPISDEELDEVRQYLKTMEWDTDRAVRALREFIVDVLPESELDVA
jgi:hypothetical protein